MSDRGWFDLLRTEMYSFRMSSIRFLPVLLVLAAFTRIASAAEIYQYFGSEEAGVSTVRKSAPSQSKGSSRYALPQRFTMLQGARYEFYPVSGKTFSAVMQSVEENSPVSVKPSGKNPSATEWGVGWFYNYAYTFATDNEAGQVHVSLEISDIASHYDITVRLPGLIDDSQLNPVEKEMWESYFMGLAEKENAKAGVITDAELKEEAESNLLNFTYFIFEKAGVPDIDRAIDFLVKEETAKSGAEWIRRIKSKLPLP